MTLGWSTSGKPPLVTNVRLASPSPAPPLAAVDPRIPAEEDFFFLRTLPLASGGIFWEGSGGMKVMPGIVPITLWREDGIRGEEHRRPAKGNVQQGERK